MVSPPPPLFFGEGGVILKKKFCSIIFMVNFVGNTKKVFYNNKFQTIYYFLSTVNTFLLWRTENNLFLQTVTNLDSTPQEIF